MAYVDFTVELTICDQPYLDADVRARLNEKGAVEFSIETLQMEEPISADHMDTLARLVHAAAVATWECNPHLQQELEEKLFDEERSRQEIACEAEYERRTGYHDVAA